MEVEVGVGRTLISYLRNPRAMYRLAEGVGGRIASGVVSVIRLDSAEHRPAGLCYLMVSLTPLSPTP